MAENEHSPLQLVGADGDLIDQLVPEGYLAERDAEIRKLVRPFEKKYWASIDDPLLGVADSRYLLFSEPGLAEAIGLNHLSPQARFCNRFYWFVRAMVIDGEQRGYYSGELQDMTLDLLQVGFDFRHIDASILEAVMHAAGYDEKMTKMPWW